MDGSAAPTLDGANIPRRAPPPRPRVGSGRTGPGSGSAAEEGIEPTAGMPQQQQHQQQRYSETMPPPPVPVSTAGSTTSSSSGGNEETGPDTRPSRSASTRSKRLSLPIAPASAFSGKPTTIPASASTGSFPATPVELSSPGITSPTDPNNFITAIATQERRVLELREELGRAEFDLKKLKRQWANHEVHRKRAESRRLEQMRPLQPKPNGANAINGSHANAPNAAAGVAAISEETAELERRKALLLSQAGGANGVPSTPIQSRRRVFTGGHTRTLSLLSPTKVSSDAFPIMEDGSDNGSVKSPNSSHDPDSPFYQNIQRYAPRTAAQLSKRASWAPQSSRQVGALKQVAGDLTATLMTFVEDLRQATVGDEPIHGGASGGGAPMRSIDGNLRGNAGEDGYSNEDLQNTVRASNGAGRHRGNGDDHSPTPSSRTNGGKAQGQRGRNAAASTSKEKDSTSTDANDAESANGKKKRFSWVPLTVDSYDDADWSSWDSPTVNSPRWSGSTANGDANALEDAENTTPVKKYQTTSPTSPMSNKSGEMAWPAALNKLTPGNIKKTASDFMKEWEKSLSEPEDEPTELARKDAVA